MERVQDRGTPGFYSRLFLVPKKNRKLRPVIDLSILNQYIKKQPFKMETVKSVRPIDIGQRLGCLHRPEGYVSSCSNSATIKEISSVHLRTSSLPIHVPKSMDFHQTNGHNSSPLASMCHILVLVPRRLAGKRFDSQLTNISHNLLPSNGTKSWYHTKSKEVRFNTSTEIVVSRHGISDTTKYSHGTSRPSRFSYSDYQDISFSDLSFGTNFPFPFGQTQCSSRLLSSRQTSFTTSKNVSIICLETSH